MISTHELNVMDVFSNFLSHVALVWLRFGIEVLYMRLYLHYATPCGFLNSVQPKLISFWLLINVVYPILMITATLAKGDHSLSSLLA